MAFEHLEARIAKLEELVTGLLERDLDNLTALQAVHVQRQEELERHTKYLERQGRRIEDMAKNVEQVVALATFRNNP